MKARNEEDAEQEREDLDLLWDPEYVIRPWIC